MREIYKAMETSEGVFRDLVLTRDLTVGRNVVISGSLTFGDAVIDTLIINGRVSTGSVAGTALDLDSTYTYNQLIEIRADVSDWTGMADNFTGAYLRFSSSTKTTSYNLRGMELNVASTTSVVNLSGLYSETQCKALAAASTWTSVRGVEANLSFYNQTETVAVTEAGCIYGTIGLGSGYSAYTGIHGLIIETRDGSTGTRTLGSGIILRNITPAEGTQTFTNGLQVVMACTTGISLEGAMTSGISITGASTFGVIVTGNASTAFDCQSGTFTTGLSIAGTVTNAIIVGACTNGLSITGTTTTAVTLSGDAATGISITSGMSATNVISIAATASTAGINISGNCTTGITIAAQTTAAITVSGIAPYALNITGAASTIGIYMANQTKPLFQGTATIAMSTHTNTVEVNAITTTDGAYVFTGGKFITYPSTNEQASVTVYGVYSHTLSALNLNAIRAVYGYVDCSAAKTIANESSALYGDVNVDNATTVSAGYISALHAKVRGDSALTGSLACIHADAEMSVDHVIYMNVDTSMTATQGIYLAGAGTYTTGIAFDGSSIFGTAINIAGTVTTGLTIGACSTAAVTITGATATGISITGACSTAVIQLGESGTPLVNDTAITAFVVGYFDSGATSGWPIGAYFTTNVTEAGGSFTALQGDAVLTAAKATVTGVENWMQLNTGGRVTGACRSLQGTIDFSNEDKGSGGVYSAACFNIKGEGASCDIGTTQRVACIELKTEGTFSAVAGENFQTKAAGYGIYINGFTPASGAVVNNDALTWTDALANVIGLRVGVGADGDAGAVYYIPLIPAAEWN